MNRYMVTWAPMTQADNNSKRGYAIYDRKDGEIIQRGMSLEQAEEIAAECERDYGHMYVPGY